MNRRNFLRLAGAVPALGQQSSKRPPNFIILFADDLGYGDLGCYGHPTIRTPNLDRMAAEGIRFTSWYAAASVCTPSRVGLLTGRYAPRAGQPGNTGPDTVGGLPLEEILLPQLLKKRGYRTGVVGKWHLGHQPAAQLPTSRGFDSYVGLPYSNDMIPPWVKTTTPLYLYRGTDRAEEMKDQTGLTQLYTREAVNFIRNAGHSPFFLYVPYAMPHLPVSASSRFSGRSRAGIYGDVIEELDWSAGEIVRTLKEQGIDRDTLVIFTSDNGPWHDLPARMLQKAVEPWHTGSKGLLRGAKGSSYEGGFRVPAIVRWPGAIPEGRVNGDIVSSLDLFPTMAKLAGADLPSGRMYDGSDLMPLLSGTMSKSPRETFYYFVGKSLEAVRRGPWKLRAAPNPELYNLDLDPSEMYNVYDRYQDVGDRLLRELKAGLT